MCKSLQRGLYTWGVMADCHGFSLISYLYQPKWTTTGKPVYGKHITNGHDMKSAECPALLLLLCYDEREQIDQSTHQIMTPNQPKRRQMTKLVDEGELAEELLAHCILISKLRCNHVNESALASR